MKLEFIALDKLSVSKANMRYGRKVPDVSDILPTVRARGILQPLIVRPNCAPDGFEIVAGARRFHAASIVAGETGQDDPLPCAILDDGDDAAAVEASLIENLARLDPDEVTQWENFVRLVKEGRKPADIAATFGLADTAVRRVLALGNLLPRIRRLYRDEAIDAATVRHLTMASKAQQKSWLALFDDPDGYVPTGYQLKSWLFGGAAISTKVALFDLEGFGGQIVGDLFGEERYFADPDQFWTAQYAAIEARRADYLEAGWGDVAIVPPGDTFHRWEYERAAKRKGGRIYIDVTQRGEVVFHEGYVTRTEARRAANDGQAGSDIKPTRPEVTGPMQTYIDLHRHAAVRAALTGHPHVALRMMVAHAITGSPLWTVRVEPQSSRNQAVAESVEVCAAEAAFDEKRRAVLGVLGFDADTPTVAGGNGDPHALARVFHRLLELPDPVVLEIVAIVMGETLVAGSAAVEALGIEIGVDMAKWWQADDAFLALLRDREILGRLVADVAGETVAAANAGEKVKTLRAIFADHLGGANGRVQVEGWVPRWMTFPPSAYTPRGGVGTVTAHALVEAARLPDDEPDPDATPGATMIAEPERLAA
jgi:ParB family transcriptional regulator, chromosome partitioning protein